MVYELTRDGRPICDPTLLSMVLFGAVKNGHLQMAYTLLQLGADANGLSIASYRREEALLWTAHSCFSEEEPPLITAVRTRCIPMVKLLLAKGADPNGQTMCREDLVCKQWMVPDKSALQFAVA